MDSYSLLRIDELLSNSVVGKYWEQPNIFSKLKTKDLWPHPQKGRDSIAEDFKPYRTKC